MNNNHSFQPKKRFQFFRNHRRLQIGFTFLILIGAAWNYGSTNSCINDQYYRASNILAKFDTLSRKTISDTSYYLSDSIPNTQFTSLTSKNMLNDARDVFQKILYEMEISKKKIFDSNTITFLISFVLVGLIAIFFENDKKVTDKIKEIDQLYKKMEQKRVSSQTQLNDFLEKSQEDQQITQFINDLQSIRLISIQIYIELVPPKINLKGPLNEYARIIDTEIEQLTYVLNTGTLNYITPNHKETILKILNKIIAFVSLDNISDPKVSSVSTILIDIQLHLQELYQRINELREYTQTRSRFSV